MYYGMVYYPTLYARSDASVTEAELGIGYVCIYHRLVMPCERLRGVAWRTIGLSRDTRLA